MNYFKDFKRERFHDENLIDLIGILNRENKIYLFEALLGLEVGTLGNFFAGYKKRDFDILLEFQNCNILIETKVDSPEGWDGKVWQTERIYNNYQSHWKNKRKIFIYLTYGLSEFYVKQRQNTEYSNGAYCTNFLHIKCQPIQEFLNTAINQCGIKDNTITTWNNWLIFELSKRKQNKEYLRLANEIISKYKEPLKLTDYPVNRMNLFLPEFTIPFYYELCIVWNQQNDQVLGKACLYRKPPINYTF